MMPYRWLHAAALSLSLLTAQALAGSAVVEFPQGGGSERVTFEYLDGKLRIQEARASDGYMLYRDGKAYIVAGGMVMDSAAIAGVFGKAGEGLPGLAGAASRDLARVRSLSDAGRVETHAGIEGRVHILRYVDDEGKEHSAEVVLSRDARAREFFDALNGFIMAMSSASEGEIELRRRLKGQGVLRYGDDLRVVSFGPDPALDRFELPQSSQSLPDLGQLFQPQQLEQLKALVEQGLPPEQQQQLEQAMKKILGGGR